jgi:hypothetical protein
MNVEKQNMLKKKFSFFFQEKVVTCFSNCNKTLQYALADKQGAVISKGFFQKEIHIPILNKQEGLYELIIIDGDSNERFLFHHQP